MSDTVRYLAESAMAAAMDRGGGGAVAEVAQQQDETTTSFGGLADYVSGSYTPGPSVCELTITDSKAIVGNVKAYFGRTLLTGASKQFDLPSPQKHKYIWARVEHPLSGSLKLSVVATDSGYTAVDMTVTFRLLYDVFCLKKVGDSHVVTVLDCRCMPQIPAYT